MAELTNDFAWSYSRERAFAGCARAYWFQYYGSWGGWESAAPARVRDAYVQKKLTTRAAWVGTRVHRAAEVALRRARDGDPVPGEEEAVLRAREAAARDVADSRSGAWLARPARRVGFAEHYYRSASPGDAWHAASAEIERQVRVLYGHRIFRRLLAVRDRVREVEDWRRFRVEDVDVIVVLDVLVEDGRGGIVVVDWKTGAHHDDADVAVQLGVYGLYVATVHGVVPPALSAMHVNLRLGTEARHAVHDAAVAQARERVLAGAAAMRGKLEDAEKNVAREESFPPLPLGSSECGSCRFRGVCGRA